MNGRVGGNEWLFVLCIILQFWPGCPGWPALFLLIYQDWPPPSKVDLAPAFLHRKREDKFFFKNQKPFVMTTRVTDIAHFLFPTEQWVCKYRNIGMWVWKWWYVSLEMVICEHGNENNSHVYSRSHELMFSEQYFWDQMETMYCILYLGMGGWPWTSLVIMRLGIPVQCKIKLSYHSY